MKIPGLYCTEVILEDGDLVARDPELLGRGEKSEIYIRPKGQSFEDLVFMSNDRFELSHTPSKLEVSSAGYFSRTKRWYENFKWEKYKR